MIYVNTCVDIYAPREGNSTASHRFQGALIKEICSSYRPPGSGCHYAKEFHYLRQGVLSPTKEWCRLHKMNVPLPLSVACFTL